MSVRTIFLSAFTKECPHCKTTINTRTLRKVPREVALRWYQFTPAPHAACPQCGGFVKTTADNSPWLTALLLLFFCGTVAAFFWPVVATFATSLLGSAIILASVCGLSWLAVKHSKLVGELPQDRRR